MAADDIAMPWARIIRMNSIGLAFYYIIEILQGMF